METREHYTNKKSWKRWYYRLGTVSDNAIWGLNPALRGAQPRSCPIIVPDATYSVNKKTIPHNKCTTSPKVTVEV